MAVKTSITEEEYLRTSFPGVDQEYQDGDLVERAMPESVHSEVQGNACTVFNMLRKVKGQPFFGRPELRHQVRPGRYLIPDVAVHWPEPPSQPVPSNPPLIVIEILSPDDRMSAVLAKLEEYLNWGVAHVWFVDPHTRVLSVYDRSGLHTVTEFPVPHANCTLTVADLFD
jgi:Uma2 family endonuclease